jgi:hypothetical protein
VASTAKKSMDTTDNDVPLGDLASAKEKRSNVKKPILPQGVRKVPEASDEHGCVYHGLMDLLALPKDYLKTYVKVGGWLYKSHARTVPGRKVVLAPSKCWMCQVF